jgi:plastocyanin
MRLKVPIVALAAALGTGACSVADAGFAPTPIDVSVGTTVTWTNLDPTAHTVSASDGSFDSGILGSDARFETTFERAGTFAYFCQIHPTMRGSVRVEGSG